MILRVDNKGRLTCRELFTPLAAFDVQPSPDGKIVLAELAEKPVPVVKPIRTAEGFLMLPQRLDARRVAAAVREDRDTR